MAVRSTLASDPGVWYELSTPQGTATMTMNATSQVISRQEYTPYGEQLAPAGTWPGCSRGYLGRPVEAGTGYTDVGARKYDPVLGRFISADPLLETASPQQLGGYTYAADNPISASDPSGLCMAAPSGATPVNCNGSPIPAPPPTPSINSPVTNGANVVIGSVGGMRLVRLTQDLMFNRMADIPPEIAKVVGNQAFSDVLQATKAWYDGPGGGIMGGNIYFTLSELQDGEYQTKIFLSSRFSLRPGLLHAWEDFGAQVYKLTGVPESSPELGHSEPAAEAFRRLMGGLPEGERIASVDEAESLRPMCGGACADSATYFVDRPGVTFEAGDNGYTSSPQVAERLADMRATGVSDPVSTLNAYAESFTEYLNLIKGLDEAP